MLMVVEHKRDQENGFCKERTLKSIYKDEREKLDTILRERKREKNTYRWREKNRLLIGEQRHSW